MGHPSEDERDGEEKKNRPLSKQKPRALAPPHGNANVFECDALAIELSLEGIETSALVIQTSATRSNTAQLRRVANRFRLQNLLIVLVGYLIAYKPGASTWLEFQSGLATSLIWLRDWLWAHSGF